MNETLITFSYMFLLECFNFTSIIVVESIFLENKCENDLFTLPYGQRNIIIYATITYSMDNLNNMMVTIQIYAYSS